MLTRRKAALLKNDGDIDSVPQKENEVPTTSPGGLNRTISHRSNKTPRAHSRGDADIERPSKRRRESPALDLASTAFNKLQSDSEEKNISPTPILSTPRQPYFTGEKFEENRLWVRFLQFSLCFAVLYALFWVLLLQVANISLSKQPLTTPPHQVSIAPPPIDPSVPNLSLFCPLEPHQNGPFLPYVILNPSEAAELDSDHAETLLDCNSRVNLDDDAVAAFVILPQGDDCEQAWRHYIGIELSIGDRGCVLVGDSAPQLIWAETSPSISCSRNVHGGGDQERQKQPLECAFDI